MRHTCAAGQAAAGAMWALWAAAAGLLGAPALGATEGAYLNSANYFYRVFGMPDFDQVRASGPGAFGLPNDGLMYCVPTSTQNILCYIANHGFPEVNPNGAQNWQSQSLYNAVGVNILGLGFNMGTDASDGTGGFGGATGRCAYLDGVSGKFTVSLYYANNNYSPTQASMTHTAVCGSLVAFGYGRYSVVGSLEGIPVIDRGGGHIVTLSRSTRGFGDSRRLWVRDPADEQTDLTSQSLFGNRSYGLLHERVVATANNFGAVKVMTEIGVDPGPVGSSNRYIDGYLAIRPKMGYSLTQNSSVLVISTTDLIQTFPSPPILEFNPDGVIEDVMISPDMTHFLAVVEDADGANALLSIDAATAEAVSLNQDLDLRAPKNIIFGRNRQLYICDDGMIRCINIDIDPPVEEAVVIPPAPVTALAFDDNRDVLVGVSELENVLIEFDERLGEPIVASLPGAVDLQQDASIAFNPAEGTLLIHPGGEQNVVYQATPSIRRGDEPYSFASIALQGVQNPTGIEVDDSGMFFVVGEDGVQAFARDENGRYGPTEESEFDGVQSDGLFRVTHSRGNDGELPQDEYFNILPPELMEGGFLVDCPFDLDGDGIVGSSDLAMLLGDWEVVAPADQDGDGVGSEELAALLGSWGPCP